MLAKLFMSLLFASVAVVAVAEPVDFLPIKSVGFKIVSSDAVAVLAAGLGADAVSGKSGETVYAISSEVVLTKPDNSQIVIPAHIYTKYYGVMIGFAGMDRFISLKNLDLKPLTAIEGRYYGVVGYADFAGVRMLRNSNNVYMVGADVGIGIAGLFGVTTSYVELDLPPALKNTRLSFTY